MSVRSLWGALARVVALVAALSSFFAHANDVTLSDLQVLSPTEVSISFSQARTDRRTGERTMLAQVANLTSRTLATPVYLAISRIEPSSVVVKGADGTSTEGTPYYLLSGAFGPGQSLSMDVVFAPTAGTRLPPFNVYPDAYNQGAVNQQPVAVAGGDAEGVVGTPVALDGTQSHDPDSGPQPLAFLWALSGPTGSAISLDNAASPTPRFTPGLAGQYLLQLKVFDGDLWSLPADHAVSVVRANAPPEG